MVERTISRNICSTRFDEIVNQAQEINLIMRKTLSAIVAITVMAFAPVSNAAEIFYSSQMDTHVLSTTNWTDTLTVFQYNGALPLSKVVITLEGTVEGNAAYESLDASPSTITLDLSANITLDRPGGGAQIIDITPLDSVSEGALAFDGNIDFDGDSGTSFVDLNGDDLDTVELTSPADLALFTGAGLIGLDAEAVGSSTGSGAGNLLTQFGTSASAKVTVDYYVMETIPEPASMAFLGLGALALVRRRRTA